MTTTNELQSIEKTTGAPRGAPVVFSGADDSLLKTEFSGAPPSEKFVVFSLNDRCYGIYARLVVEVARPLDVAVLPRSPEWLAGISNLRGEIIPILNPAKIFGDQTIKYSGTTKFIVLRVKSFDSLIALPVDRLKEIAALDEKEFKPAAQKDGAFVFAIVAYQTTILHLIDAEEMLASIAFD
jgi:purine-binding chemotaxis protein CheW